jgi:hypothetical protein
MILKCRKKNIVDQLVNFEGKVHKASRALIMCWYQAGTLMFFSPSTFLAPGLMPYTLVVKHQAGAECHYLLFLPLLNTQHYPQS